MSAEQTSTRPWLLKRLAYLAGQDRTPARYRRKRHERKLRL